MTLLTSIRSVIKLLVGLIMAVDVISICLGVITRYLLNVSLGWTDELAGFSLVWVTFLGSAWALIDNNHISFEGIAELLPQRWQKVLRIVAILCAMLFALVLIVAGTSVTIKTWGNRAISMPISRGLVVSVLPFSGVIMMLALVVQLFSKEEVKGEAVD